MNQDLLSDVLRSVRLRGAVYFNVSGGHAWAAEAPEARAIAATVMPASSHVMEFHMVLRGSCYATVAGLEPVRLEQGDLVVLAQGDRHVMSSAPGMRVLPAHPDAYRAYRPAEAPFAYHLDGELASPVASFDHRADTVLVCGFFGCDSLPYNPLLSALPRILHLRAGQAGDWVPEFMQHAAAESMGQRARADALL